VLKKGIGSERHIKIPSEYARREVPVPLFKMHGDDGDIGLLLTPLLHAIFNL
jgi:hypothetical protein